MMTRSVFVAVHRTHVVCWREVRMFTRTRHQNPPACLAISFKIQFPNKFRQSLERVNQHTFLKFFLSGRTWRTVIYNGCQQKELKESMRYWLKQALQLCNQYSQSDRRLTDFFDHHTTWQESWSNEQVQIIHTVCWLIRVWEHFDVSTLIVSILWSMVHQIACRNKTKIMGIAVTYFTRCIFCQLN